MLHDIIGVLDMTKVDDDQARFAALGNTRCLRASRGCSQ